MHRHSMGTYMDMCRDMCTAMCVDMCQDIGMRRHRLFLEAHCLISSIAPVFNHSHKTRLVSLLSNKATGVREASTIASEPRIAINRTPA